HDQTVGSLILQNGAILTTGNAVTVTGTFEWDGGTLQGVGGHGSLTTAGGGTISVATPHIISGGFHLINPSGPTITWDMASYSVGMTGAAVLDNYGTLAIPGYAQLVGDDWSTLNNHCTLRQPTGSIGSSFAIAIFNNTGTID